MKKLLFAVCLVAGLMAVVAPPQAFAQEEKPFTLHGEVRIRGEYNNNAQDFADTGDDALGLPCCDDGAFYWPYRVRIAAEGHFTKNVVGWIEFQNTGVGGGNGSPRHSGDIGDDVYPYQAYVALNQLWSKSFSLKFGRQEIVAGNEFLLGDEDFYAGISHDGVVGTWDFKDFDIMVWWTRPVEGQFFFPPDATPDLVVFGSDNFNINFSGGYFSWTILKNQNLDFYLMSLNDRGISASVQTAGARYGHETMDKNSFVWNFEVAKQFGTASNIPGSVGFDEIDASGLGAEAMFGFNFKSDETAHRVYAKIEYATGDDATTGDDFEGFIGLFGDLHNRAGRGDWFHVQETDAITGLGVTGLGGGLAAGGLQAWSVGYTGWFADRHEFGIAYWDYSLEEDNASVLGDELGQAWDLWYGFNFSRNVAFQTSYSMLRPGDALTGVVVPVSDDSVERMYGQVRLRF